MNDQEIVGLDEIQEQEYVYLIDNKNNEYKINKDIAIKVSGFIRESFEADSKSHDSRIVVKCEEIIERRLVVANPIVVKKIHEWMEYVIKNPPPFIPKPIQLNSFKKIIKKHSKATSDEEKEIESEWYRNWINLPPHDIFNIITAANYLEMNKYTDNYDDSNNNSYSTPNSMAHTVQMQHSSQDNKDTGLLNICCVKIASLIKGKEPKDIKTIMEYKGPIDEIDNKLCGNS